MQRAIPPGSTCLISTIGTVPENGNKRTCIACQKHAFIKPGAAVAIDQRIEAHIFVAFMAYCLQVTLKQRTRSLAPGLTPRAVLDKMAAIQMVDVHLPTTDGRQVVLSRYTDPEPDQMLLLQRMRMTLPDQPPPRITAPADVANAA